MTNPSVLQSRRAEELLWGPVQPALATAATGRPGSQLMLRATCRTRMRGLCPMVHAAMESCQLKLIPASCWLVLPWTAASSRASP